MRNDAADNEHTMMSTPNNNVPSTLFDAMDHSPPPPAEPPPDANDVTVLQQKQYGTISTQHIDDLEQLQPIQVEDAGGCTGWTSKRVC